MGSSEEIYSALKYFIKHQKDGNDFIAVSLHAFNKIISRGKNTEGSKEGKEDVKL